MAMTYGNSYAITCTTCGKRLPHRIVMKTLDFVLLIGGLSFLAGLAIVFVLIQGYLSQQHWWDVATVVASGAIVLPIFFGFYRILTVFEAGAAVADALNDHRCEQRD